MSAKLKLLDQVRQTIRRAVTEGGVEVRVQDLDFEQKLIAVRDGPAIPCTVCANCLEK